MTRRGYVAILVVILAVAGGLWLLRTLTADPNHEPAQEGSTTAPQQGGEPITVRLLKEPVDVPPFVLTDLDGKTMSSKEWRGKVVLLNVWATWCPPCRAEIPDLVALQQEYRDRLVIVGISEDEGTTDSVRKFSADHKINYPIVMSTPEFRERFPGVSALPTTFVLDRDGRMVQKHVGLLRADETEAQVRVLAGLEVNAKIERVDDPGKLSPESVAQLKEIPGVDLKVLSPDQRGAALQALNGEKCTCGCDLTVAKCRIDDPQCPVSLPLAKSMVEKLARATP